MLVDAGACARCCQIEADGNVLDLLLADLSICETAARSGTPPARTSGADPMLAWAHDQPA